MFLLLLLLFLLFFSFLLLLLLLLLLPLLLLLLFWPSVPSSAPRQRSPALATLARPLVEEEERMAGLALACGWLTQGCVHLALPCCLLLGPYLLMTCSLVPEHYGQSGAGESLELPSNFLVGTLASSIHRLRDADNAEGGFFVFGDLSVRREGQFRLRFALYDRDGYSPWADYVFVAELISNVFTVFPAKLFPGMGESTALTRAFSDQGVKLRLRREMSGTVAPRRRGHGMGGGGGGGGAVGGGMSKNKYDEAMGDEAARGGLAQAQTQAQQDGGLMLTEAMMMPPMMAEVGVPVCLGPVVGGFPLLAPQGLDEEEAVQLFCYPFEEAAAGRGR